MIAIRFLGLQPYLAVWENMKQFTIERNEETMDEVWILEHPSVYTQGQAGRAEHILDTHAIPLVQSDRGGQITYHGPGQLIAYILMDIGRRKMGIRTLVSKLEQLLIQLLKNYHITANTRCGAPGVYVNESKIASIGLRVKKGCTYHGIALNVAMDLSPFSGINPCGHARLQMTQMKDFISEPSLEEVGQQLSHELFTIFEPSLL